MDGTVVMITARRVCFDMDGYYPASGMRCIKALSTDEAEVLYGSWRPLRPATARTLAAPSAPPAHAAISIGEPTTGSETSIAQAAQLAATT
jgi:hypothetical protein